MVVSKLLISIAKREMTKRELHKQCLNILRGIEHFENRAEVTLSEARRTENLFPVLNQKHLNRVDTFNRCVNRLNKKYIRTVNKLVKL